MKRIQFKKMLVLFSMLTVAVALSACSGDKQEKSSKTETESNSMVNEPTNGGSIVVGIAQDIEDGLDPHNAVAAGTREILFNIFEGLVKPDENGNLIDAVAKSHVVSEDGKTYTFTLRDDIKFHNGDAVTVEDIKYSIERVADVGPLTSVFSNVEAVNIKNDSEVEIVLKEADTEFLAYLTVAIIPKSVKNIGDTPIGTGPFKYISRSPGENLIIEKFNDYWGQKAYLDKVTYKVIEDVNTIVTNLKSGSIDMFARLTSVQMSELTDVCNANEGTMNLVQALYINNEVEPFNNPDVRRALSYASDPQEIMGMISDGKGVAIGSSMFPNFKKYYMPELADMYNKDIAKAKELLAKAGYPDGFDMTITVPSNYQPHLDTAQVLVEQFKEIGVNATIQPVEWSTWISDVYVGRNYETTVIGVDASILTGRALLERFYSKASGNFINYNNSKYDELYEKVETTTNEEEQIKLYKEMQTILAEDAANVYIQDMLNIVALNKKYDGYVFYPLYVQDLSKIYLKQQ